MRRAIFLGPPKSGSSWVQRLFEWHPAIAVPIAKELFFFDRFYNRGIDWYEAQFATDGRSEVVAEVCHDYLFSPRALARIHHHYPDAVLFVCLRHPLQRAVSSHLYKQRQGRTRSVLHNALRADEELLSRGRYAHHLTDVIDVFPREQLVLLDFELLKADPQSFADQLIEGVGLAATKVPDRLLAPARPASEARLQPLATVGHRVAQAMRLLRLEAVVGRLKTSPLIERLLFRRLGGEDRPRPTLADWELARGVLRDDTRRLDEMFGTDYTSRWWDIDPSTLGVAKG